LIVTGVQTCALPIYGKAKLSVALNDLPELTRPLAATIRVGVFEPSGRAVSETLTRPIRQRALFIGLHSPAGNDAVAEGAEATLRSEERRVGKEGRGR